MADQTGDDIEIKKAFLAIQRAIGRKIKKLRLERNLTQRQLSQIAGMSGPHYGLIEAGVGNVTLLVLVKIGQALGVSVSVFFEGVGGAGSAIDTTIVRLTASAEKVVRHLEDRRDEFAQLADALLDFQKEYGGAPDEDEGEGENQDQTERDLAPGPEPVRKMPRRSKGKREAG